MTETALIHATCVTVGDFGVLITGASGSGKSSLALQLMSLGAALVADDRVILTRQADTVVATCPATLENLIEARGVGILNANAQRKTTVRLVIDMDTLETDRIPHRREVTRLGCRIPLLHRVDAIHLPSAILQWMRAGRSDR